MKGLLVDVKLDDEGKVSVEKTRETMMVKITAPKKDKVEAAVDVVAVLDTSGSMGEGTKLQSLKRAMKHVIEELGDKHRLSIVTFSDQAQEKLKLLTRNKTMREEAKRFVDYELRAEGWTMMSDGLKKGLEVLGGRRNGKTNPAAIFLMSDGHENYGSDAAKVAIPEDVDVYTYGLGEGHDSKLLKNIAKNSSRGLYNPGDDDDLLKVSFAQTMTGLKSIVIQDLKLTLTPVRGVTTSPQLEKPPGGGDNNVDNYSPAYTWKVKNLFAEEIYRANVPFILPQTDKEGAANVARLEWEYRLISRGTFPDAKTPGSRTISVDRTRQATPRTRPLAIAQRSSPTAAERFSAAAEPDRTMHKKVRTELARDAHVTTMKEAKKLAKKKLLDEARDNLADAMNRLDEITGWAPYVSENAINTFYNELAQLRNCMDTQEMFDTMGVSFARAAILSHDRQRFAARGEVGSVRLFATPLMDQNLKDINNGNDDDED